MNNNWTTWVRTVTHGASARQIAKNVGVSPTAVSKWLNTGPTASAVVGIAVAYHAPIIEGLVASGLINDTDLCGVFTLQWVPTDQLVAELRRRSLSVRKAS